MIQLLWTVTAITPYLDTPIRNWRNTVSMGVFAKISQTGYSLKGSNFDYICPMDSKFWQDVPVNKKFQLTTCWMWATHRCVFYRPDILWKSVTLNIFVVWTWNFDRMLLSIRTFNWQHAECEQLTDVYFTDQIFFESL